MDYDWINDNDVPVAILDGMREATGSAHAKLSYISHGRRILIERFSHYDRSPTVRRDRSGNWYLWIPRTLDGKSRLRIELGQNPCKEQVIVAVKPYAVKWSKAYMEKQEKRRQRVSDMEQRRTERLMMLETIGLATPHVAANVYSVRTAFWGMDVVVVVNEQGCTYQIESASPAGRVTARDEYTELMVRLVRILNKLP